jgi:hypothetical protein
VLTLDLEIGQLERRILQISEPGRMQTLLGTELSRVRSASKSHGKRRSASDRKQLSSESLMRSIEPRVKDLRPLPVLVIRSLRPVEQLTSGKKLVGIIGIRSLRPVEQ